MAEILYLNQKILLLFILIYTPYTVFSNDPSTDQTVMKFMDKWGIMGGQIAISKDGVLIYSRSFGEAELNKPVSNKTLFRIASLSKPITAVAIFKLIEEGKLQLNDKVFGKNGILDTNNFSFSDSLFAEITVQNLLEHTAGWDRDLTGDPMFLNKTFEVALGQPYPFSKEAIIKLVLSNSLDFKPNKRFAYSNFGYLLLGRIIEKITGMPYDDYMKIYILYPLGIKEMKLGRNYFENKAENEAVYFNPFSKTPLFTLDNNVNGETINIEAMDAHGGWIASAEELILFLNGIKNEKIIKSETATLMLQSSTQNPNYAKGWFVNDVGNIWHTGSLKGASSMMAKTNSGYDVVMLFNTRPESQKYFPSLDKLMWDVLKNLQDEHKAVKSKITLN